MIPPSLILLSEAARILRTSSANLRQAIKRGSLIAYKHGRDYWVERSEVSRFERENRRYRKDTPDAG